MAGQDDNGNVRDPKDELIIEALAAGRSYSKVAATTGVSARTVRRRMSDPAFAAEVSRRRGEHVSAITGQLVSQTDKALHVLSAALESESESIRLKAAEMIFQWSVRLRGAQELEQRIAALEQAADEIKDVGES